MGRQSSLPKIACDVHGDCSPGGPDGPGDAGVVGIWVASLQNLMLIVAIVSPSSTQTLLPVPPSYIGSSDALKGI
jgi:hypothetical protein